MRCDRYNYTYLASSHCLVVSLHQILVAFAGFSLEFGSDKPSKYLCANISSAIRAMEGKQKIEMLIQYYYQIISRVTESYRSMAQRSSTRNISCSTSYTQSYHKLRDPHLSSKFSQFCMFCNDNSSKLVLESTHSGVS